MDVLSDDSPTSTPPAAACQDGHAMTAPALAAAVHAGDEAAFSELHRRYAARLTRYAVVLARGNEHTAAETVQNAFLRAIRSLRQVPDADALWCWLARAARCAAADAARRESRQGALRRKWAALFAADPPPPAEDPEKVWYDALAAAVSALPPDEQGLLHARYTERISLEETAARTGSTARAVESRLARLRSRLRTAILHDLSRLP